MTTPTPTPAPTPATTPTEPGFARRFWPVWLAGLAGVLALALQAPDPALLDKAPELKALPPAALRVLLLVNPLILMTLMALAGALLAHRAGLTSLLAGTAPRLPGDTLRRRLGSAAIVGVVAGLVLGSLDAFLAPLLGPQWQAVMADTTAKPVLTTLTLGVLYGGLTEEVMMRWGLMSLLLVALLQAGRLTGRAPGTLAGPVMAGTAITVAALVFAAGHLPALAALIEPTPAIVARTLLLNLLAGGLYGWLFWRRGLEAAMLAHAGTHAGFALCRLLLPA